ncbi:hypothetical protein J6590_043189, partial [Homalodisca vitripennis]
MSLCCHRTPVHTISQQPIDTKPCQSGINFTSRFGTEVDLHRSAGVGLWLYNPEVTGSILGE